MKTLRNVMTMLSHRVVAVSALIAAVALMVGYISFNMRTITVSDGTQSHSILSISTDSGMILRAVGLTVDPDDVVTAEWGITTGEINVTRAVDVAIHVDGVVRTIGIAEGTVADALQKAAITLGTEDIVSLPLDMVITEPTTITVDRVTYVDRVVTEAVAFGSTSIESNDYKTGTSVVVTNGVDGEKQVTYRDRLINGEVVETFIADETVTKAPVDQVTAVGTHPYYTHGGAGTTPDFSYSAVYRGLGTAYTNENGLCGKYTASGMLAQVGVVAVNPKMIPYGTRLYITTPDGSYTYGYCVAGDTGGFIYSRPDTIVDVFFNTAAECYQWGRREVIVYVLD